MQVLQQKNIYTSEKKSSPSEEIDSYALIVEEMRQLETRLEDHISKSNVLEIELEKIKQDILENRT